MENKRFLNEFERGVADCRGIYVTSIFVELYGKDWAMFRECMFMRLSFAFKDAGLKVICRYGSVYKIEKWWQAWDEKEPTRQNTDCNNINPSTKVSFPCVIATQGNDTFVLLIRRNARRLWRRRLFHRRNRLPHRRGTGLQG